MHIFKWIAVPVVATVTSMIFILSMNQYTEIVSPKETVLVSREVSGLSFPTLVSPGAMPFSLMDCAQNDGVRPGNPACLPDVDNRDNSLLGNVRPEIRAKSALASIEAREFDKLYVLSQSYLECFSSHSSFDNLNSSNDLKKFGSPVVHDCDFSLLEGFTNKALSSIYAAANQGDFIAREAYVDLLLTKTQVSEFKLDAKPPRESVDVISPDDKKTLSDIDSFRSQIVTFITALNEPSDRLTEILNLLTVLQGQVRSELVETKEK